MPTSVRSVPKQTESIIRATDIVVTRGLRNIVDGISLRVDAGQRWVILGPNGCGKTTLLKVLSLYLHPSRGDIEVLGRSLGTFDIRPVRPRIAYASASLATELRPALTALEVVMIAKNGALEPWWHDYDDADRDRARECLRRLTVEDHADRPFGSLSSGEQQRVLLARSLMNDPVCLLLDEPSARLDLGGREHLVRILDAFARDNASLPSVIVTHHVDEIPVSTTHTLMMRDGQSIAAGPISEVLTSANLSECFGMDLEVSRRPNGRFTAFAR
ncbi:MAG: hypothetical protein RL573_374 [Actinomycetota bacterium]